MKLEITPANQLLHRFMGQDGVYLQVIATSGEGKEQKHAHKVLTLLKRGKHWVLVTLLLANVIVNESLPIVLDRSLGGGWPAVVGSTALIGRAIADFIELHADYK
jgi:metal transporter CNNM